MKYSNWWKIDWTQFDCTENSADVKQGTHTRQPTAGPVPHTCAQPYNAGSGSHGQLFRPYSGPSTWQGRWANERGKPVYRRPFPAEASPLRWLDIVFQGQYLPSLSVNYVATNVLDKDENLLWSGLQWHRSCHSNEMTPLPILLAALFLGTGNCSSKIVYWNFFLQQPPGCSWSLSEICKKVMEIFWEQVFMVRNTVIMDNLDVRLLSVLNEALLACNFTS